jgi:putative phosphoribosyl transferase
LSISLVGTQNREDAVVLALPPGGVPVGFEIARALAAPLDIMVVRRLEAPNRPELAMGVVSADGGLALNYELIRWLNISDATIDEVVASESLECSRLDKAYRGDAPRLDLAGKVIIAVDDGIVIASAMRGAIAILRLRRPKRLVIAAPVASAPSVLDLQTQVDDVVACATLNEFEPVDRCYEDVAEISEESVREFYERAMRRVQVAQKTLVTQHTMRSCVAQASVNAAIEALGRTLAVELAPRRANVVYPGSAEASRW